MSVDVRSLGVSFPRIAVTVAVFALFAFVLLASEESLSPLFLLLVVVTGVFFVVSIFDAVSGHDLFELASTLWLTVVFVLWYTIDGATLAALLSVVTAIGVLVEAYNYRHGTSYLRFDSW